MAVTDHDCRHDFYDVLKNFRDKASGESFQRPWQKSCPKRLSEFSICRRRRIERNFTPETFRQRITKILSDGNYEETDSEKLARDVDFPPARQTDPEKLAPKLISVLVATMLWYLIKNNVATTPSSSEPRGRPTATETP